MEPAANKTPSKLRRGLLLVAKLALASALVAWLSRSGRLDFHHLARVHLDGAMLGVIAGQIIVHLLVELYARSPEEASEVLEGASRGILEITSLAEESRPPAHAPDEAH